MKQHKTPCNKCPFRRKAPAGWLGGFTPAQFAQMAQSELRMPCHKSANALGVDNMYDADPSIPQCAGRAIHWANQYKLPRSPELLVLPKDTDAVFSFPSEFFNYHNNSPVKEKD